MFLQFGGPIEKFDIHTKLSLEFMVGLTTPPPPPPPPGAKGLVKLNHLYGITTCKCIAECFHHFPTLFILFINIHEYTNYTKNIIYMSVYAMKGLYLSFNLVSNSVV